MTVLPVVRKLNNPSLSCGCDVDQPVFCYSFVMPFVPPIDSCIIVEGQCTTRAAILRYKIYLHTNQPLPDSLCCLLIISSQRDLLTLREGLQNVVTLMQGCLPNITVKWLLMDSDTEIHFEIPINGRDGM